MCGKWAKDKKTTEYALVVDPSKGKTKLKKYTVNVTGLVVGGKGTGEATCKKPVLGPWAVMVE